MSELYKFETTTAGILGNGTPIEDDTPDIKVVVTEERMQRLKSGHWRKAQAGDYDAQMHVIAHFMVNDRGTYVGQAEAIAVLDEFSMGDIIAALGSLNESIGEVAVPKA